MEAMKERYLRRNVMLNLSFCKRYRRLSYSLILINKKLKRNRIIGNGKENLLKVHLTI